MFPGSPRSSGSILDRFNQLSNTQKLMVAGVVLLLLYALFAPGAGGFDISQIVVKLIIIFIAFPVHEFAHAAMAVNLGDETPRKQGRYTLNPLVHIDPFGALLLFFSGFGWAKPVQWNPGNVSIDPKIASILVSLAGPVSNLILAILALLVKDYLPSSELMDSSLFFFVYINVLLFVFNLIPIPPLDGSHVLFALLPGDTFALRQSLSQYSMIFLIGIIFFVPQVISGPTEAIMRLLINTFG